MVPTVPKVAKEDKSHAGQPPESYRYQISVGYLLLNQYVVRSTTHVRVTCT
jgi:hypothetical protein